MTTELTRREVLKAHAAGIAAAAAGIRSASVRATGARWRERA